MSKTTFKVTSAERERIIVNDHEKIKVDVKFSNGEFRSYHFDLDASEEAILASLEKAAALFDSEKIQAEANAERLKAEKQADATIAALTNPTQDV